MDDDGGRGGGRERGGGWECGGVGGAVGGVAVAETSPAVGEIKAAILWEEELEELGEGMMMACLYLYLKISVLIELRSACKVWSWCWRAEMAPMQP